MKVVTPPKPIHTSEIVNEDLIVTIPARKRWFEIIWFTLCLLFAAPFVYLFGWLTFYLLLPRTGQYGAVSAIASPSSMVFACVVFVFLTPPAILLPLMLIYALLWRLAGTEIVTANKDLLVVNRKILFWESHKAYKTSEISSMLISRPTDGWIEMFVAYRSLLGGSGTIAFDYGAKTFRFGDQLDEAEDRQIIREIQSHLAGFLPAFEIA